MTIGPVRKNRKSWVIISALAAAAAFPVAAGIVYDEALGGIWVKDYPAEFPHSETHPRYGCDERVGEANL